MLSEYKEVFLEELNEQLQLMDDGILKLEQAGNSEQAIQSLFRAAHTLKGSSAAMGFEEMKRLTHEMEHLLDLVRKNKLETSTALIDLLFTSLDLLKQLKSDFENYDRSSTDISECVRQLQAFADNPRELPPALSPAALKPELNLNTRLKVQELQDQGHRAYWIRVRISPECVIKGARAYVIYSNLSEWGEVLLTSPEIEGLEGQNDSPPDIFYLYAGKQDLQDILSFVSTLVDVVEHDVEPVELSETVIVNPAPIAPEQAESEEQAQASGSVSGSKSPTIRVSVERLEHLMNLVGELVIDQTRIFQVKRMQSQQVTHESVDELGAIADHLSRIIGDLQESVMKARMLPIEQLFNRFPRMIRDLSRNLGKELELVLEGKDTELDRTLIEEIADPLIHLIRNAVDHGIEMPEKREQLGKHRKGTLRIRAAHEDNQVVIYVEDDGGGIDPAKMKKSALEKAIIDPALAEQLTDKEAIELIFRPGFSTAQAVSDISGRGVGMDIVKSHIQKLNGLIDVETKLGEATRFIIKLPLTLAIIVGLLVKLHDQTYIIPMSNITEIVRVTYDELISVRGQPVIMLRERVIPVVWMHDRFGLPRSKDGNSHLSLVIVGSAEKRLALAVDELIGNQEIVIKSLGSYLGKADCISGATILGDGKIALILEISDIIDSFIRLRK
ncbi:chemotaxis protein CheA [Paenibacillus thermotolerans]|uniref:chemotaxis protein CheA n=1 Tax=Paenibacillus thermotolerans TaxID=3027807 RepID=UPI002368ACA1|nr:MULTISPECIES: chemotaxis protein CheA [unclassified Paenibacillus]